MLEKTQSVYAGHVDIRQHHVQGRFIAHHLQGLLAVMGVQKAELAEADMLAKTSGDQHLQFRLGVHHQDMGRHGRSDLRHTVRDRRG